MSDASHRDLPHGVADRCRRIPRTRIAAVSCCVRRRRGRRRGRRAGARGARPRSSTPAEAQPGVAGVSGNRARAQLLRDDAPLIAQAPARRVFRAEFALTHVFSRRRIMLLTRKTDTARVAGPRLSRGIGARIATMDRRAFLKRSGLVAGAGAFASQLPYGTMGKAQAADETAERQARSASHRLHALLGRLLDRRRRRERRVGAAGAGVRFAAQPRRALREGRVDPRARPRRASAEVADEARQRQVPEDQLGAGDQRGRRQAARDPQGIGSRRGVLGRQLEAQQRAVVPAAQVRLVLRHATTATTRRASAIRRPSPAWPTPGATAR